MEGAHTWIERTRLALHLGHRRWKWRRVGDEEVSSPSGAREAAVVRDGSKLVPEGELSVRAPKREQRVQEDLSETTDPMRQNIEAAVDRGEHLELPVDKSDGLTANAAAFQKQSCGLRHALRWKIVKILLGIGTAGLLLLALIVRAEEDAVVRPAWPSPSHARACNLALTGLISEYRVRAAVSKGVIFTRPAGGLGNQLNNILHAFVRAMLSDKRLVVASTRALEYFEETPLYTIVNSHRAAESLNRSGVSIEDRSMDGRSEVWMIFSGKDHELWNAVHQNLTHNASALVSCASHLLFQPNRTVRTAMADYLSTLRGSHSVGIHLRQSDYEMARRQHATRRRSLSLTLHQLRGCLGPDDIPDATVACASRAAYHSMLMRWQRATLFVASDTASAVTAVKHRLGALGARLVTSRGQPYHVGRGFVMPAGEDPYVKALIDFFIMDHVDEFYSNCDLLTCFEGGLPASLWRMDVRDGSTAETIVETNASHSSGWMRKGCGNTFAANMWLRRFGFHTHSPDLTSCARFRPSLSLSFAWILASVGH